MNAAFPGNYYPPNTAIAIHGHVHDFQAFNFSSNHPATFVAGNGGDNLDSALPAAFNPNGDLPAPNTVVNAFAYSQEFGFMVMDRVGAVGAKNWKFTSYRTNGTVIAVCSMAAADRLQRHLRHHARQPDHLHGRNRHRGRQLRQHPVSRRSPEVICAEPGSLESAQTAGVTEVIAGVEGRGAN